LRATAAYHNGLALDRLGRAADAETWLGRALTLDPALGAALLYTGILRERRGELQGAGRAYLDYSASPRTPRDVSKSRRRICSRSSTPHPDRMKRSRRGSFS
jgi:Flp pilus assembly protein TadD